MTGLELPSWVSVDPSFIPKKEAGRKRSAVTFPYPILPAQEKIAEPIRRIVAPNSMAIS
jgi:hypothetical protein